MLKHGTNKGWEAGCRKRCCINARQRFRYGMNQTGRSPMVPVSRVVERLNHLWKQHPTMTYDEVADHIGVSRRLVQYWMSGEVERLRRDKFNTVVERLSTLEVSTNWISSLGASRRIKAMNYRGFSQKWIAGETGLALSMIRDISRRHRKTVSLVTHEKIKRVMHLSMHLDPNTFPNAKRVRARSRMQGHLPLGAWEDIDDPRCEPEPVADTDLEFCIERLKVIVGHGHSMNAIANFTGMAYQNLHNLFTGKSRSCRPETLKKLFSAADHFELLPDPEGPSANQVRSVAKKNGWV